MNLLALLLVRNAEDRLQTLLDSVATCCRSILVLNDRSTDGTLDVLRNHPAVTNIFSSNNALPLRPWFFSESMCLNLLYRMADFHMPDWIIALSDDETVDSFAALSEKLEAADPNTAGFQLRRISTWDDPLYPLMVPLMSKAKGLDGRIWRYHPNLMPGTKWLHNGYIPANIETFGGVETLEGVTLIHHGWNTLERRLEKANTYYSLDPDCKCNFGVPYDKGLLFGYDLNHIHELIAEYQRRFSAYQKEWDTQSCT